MCTVFAIPLANLRGNVVRTFLGKSDFYWALVVLAEQWQCSLSANGPLCPEFCSYYVPSIFANGRVTNGRVPPFPISKARNACLFTNMSFTILVPL